MIQWYFDLDGVVFDFDSALIKMVNETLGKNYGKEVLKPYSYELGMGLTKDMVNHYLKQMTAENRWETLATYDTIHFLYMIECAEHFRQEYDLGLSFITSRSHETLPQTLRCFQNLLVPMGFRRKYPLLYSDKATGVYKWSVIKALEMGEGGVYVMIVPHTFEKFENIVPILCVFGVIWVDCTTAPRTYSPTTKLIHGPNLSTFWLISHQILTSGIRGLQKNSL